jgi:MerR family transcriptional regulator, light-induced transcriptional regulator
MTGLTIGQLAERTGVAAGTLRMWERRHGFPAPERLPSGHRRYPDSSIEAVRRVANERAAGMSLAGAIARVKRTADAAVPAVPSVFATLRRRCPELEPQTLRKPFLLALTRAIEDESLSRAQIPILFGAFQSERFYRREQRRWRQLSQAAELAIAFADFTRVRKPQRGPIEIPVPRDHPFMREWVLVCGAEDHSACVVGWEAPHGDDRPDRLRTFETVWSVEPEVVREAARICAAVVETRLPHTIDRVRPRLDAEPGPPSDAQLRLATAITSRALAYLS